MLLDQGQLCVVEVLSHIGDENGNYRSRDVEPFHPVTAPSKFLNTIEERGLLDMIEGVGRCCQGGSG